MRESPRHVRLAPGVALHSVDAGLLARTPARWVRIDLRDRRLEANLVSRLSRGSIHVDESERVAIDAMERAGLLVSEGDELVLVVDCSQPEAMPPDLGLRVSVATARARADDDGTFVLVGAPDDNVLGELAGTLVERGRRSIVVWIDERGVAIARDDGARRGCVLCAWRQDSALARYVAPGLAVGRGPRAIGGAATLGQLAASRVRSIVGDPSAQPAAGEVWVFERASAVASVYAVTPHPGCFCARRAEGRERTAPDADWDALASRRFAPIWPVDRGAPTRAARVVYRRSRSAWRADVDALGVALGAGDGAEVRALAEGIERFCMLDAPPDVQSTVAGDLTGEVLSHDAIRSLTFRDADYLQPGFRFQPFTEDEPIDWSIAHCSSDGRRVWVPTSLVGRVPRGSTALVDATSNGYACHVDRDVAITSALYELVERDAVLLHWYARLAPLPRIDVELGIEGASALLATQDIDVPVVLAVARRPDGSMRCASAAAASIDEALRRARAELEVALEGTSAPGEHAALTDPGRRYEPDDHLRHYAGSRGNDAYARLVASAPSVGIAELRERWPAQEQARAAVERALEARSLTAWIVDRSLPDVFGFRWHVVRALVPGLVELSWGQPYRRLASPRIAERMRRAAVAQHEPHPVA